MDLSILGFSFEGINFVKSVIGTMVFGIGYGVILQLFCNFVAKCTGYELAESVVLTAITEFRQVRKAF